jgi:seryl-tRNA synthetase
MSDTPRTDEAWNAVSRTPDGRYATDVPLRQLASVMCEHSKQLERELADMTKQRDEAKRKRNEIFQALNKERQWMHEKMEAIRETMKEFNQWLK